MYVFDNVITLLLFPLGTVFYVIPNLKCQEYRLLSGEYSQEGTIFLEFVQQCFRQCNLFPVLSVQTYSFRRSKICSNRLFTYFIIPLVVWSRIKVVV